MAIITKQLAESIAKKLGAVIDRRRGRPHDLAYVYEGETLIAKFGIRRGSGKETGHDHVPGSLYLGPHDTKLLGECPMSRDRWIEILREKGRLT